MPMFNKINSSNLGSMFFKLLMIWFFGFLLFFMGVFTALSPQFIARLSVFPILAFLILFALLGCSKKELSDKTLDIWLVTLLVTMALWPTYLLFKFGGLPAFDARRVVAGLTIGAALYLVISRSPLRDQYKHLFHGHVAICTWLIISYTFLRTASCFASVSTLYSLTQVFWELLYYYSMFFIGAIFFHKQSLQSLTIKIFMWLTIFIAFYACVEWVFQKNILVQFSPSNDQFSALQKALQTSRLREGFFRAQGTFEHPLLLAEFAAMAVCFSLSTLLWQFSDKKSQLLTIFTLVAALVTAVLTGSRSALISIAVSAALIFIIWLFSNSKAQLKTKASARKVMSMMTLTTLILLALPVITLLIKGGSKFEAASSTGRLYMLELGWESIKVNPLLGTGPGTSGAVAGIVTGAGIGTLDNYFLAVVIESGIPALIFLVLFLIYPVWILFNKLIEAKSGINSTFLSAVMGCLVVTTIVHTILWMPYNLFFAFLLTGMAMSSLSQPKSLK